MQRKYCEKQDQLKYHRPIRKIIKINEDTIDEIQKIRLIWCGHASKTKGIRQPKKNGYLQETKAMWVRRCWKYVVTEPTKQKEFNIPGSCLDRPFLTLGAEE